ncbi:hypothetical protein M0805_004264 [Coniferiporia weirii]|nr:hypothetical protein M0805_004264 [Coniferiporia weirii]
MPTTVDGQDTPPALPAHVVTLLLTYLSSLDRPLPTHLLSAPLRQRHHFLGLADALDTPQDVAAYLSWPSASISKYNARRIVDLLGALPSPDNFDPLVAYPSKYSYDGDAMYAHARVSVHGVNFNSADELRLVFRWEPEDGEHALNSDGWKYHDMKLMPFPPGALDVPQFAPDFTDSPSPSVSYPTTFEPRPYHTGVGPDPDEVAYWNSYGVTSSDDDEEGDFLHRPHVTGEGADDEKTEDAYWAQYADVHGTADSTHPSPLPSKRRLHDPSQPLPGEFPTSSTQFDTRRADSDVEHIEHLYRFSSSHDDLPPAALTRRLYALSPRVSPSPSSASLELARTNVTDADANFTSRFDSPKPSQTSDEPTLTPPAHSPIKIDTNIEAPPREIVPTPFQKSDEHSSSEAAKKAECFDDEIGLRDAIKGVYRLWSSSCGSRKVTTDAVHQKEMFLRAVRDVVYGS